MKMLSSSLLLSSLLSISSAASAQPLDMEKLLENVPEYQDLNDMEKGFMKMGSAHIGMIKEELGKV